MWRSFRLTDSFSQKYVLTAKRCWWRPGALLNFLYLNGESEHLTQLRAAIGRTWPVSVRSVRSCRIFGRLSALRVRMTITYSPNPRHNNRSNHPRPRPNERTSEADGRSAIGDLRATNDERRSPTGARGLPGAAPACGLWFFFGKKNSTHTAARPLLQQAPRGAELRIDVATSALARGPSAIGSNRLP